ncbi:Putative Thiamin biosynthesis protein (Thi-4) [[Torrubiella] hemipterigena]|uniref:Putative Thiamin biosynthesis protein (Thi-4) n=1 Tax=[Torrubiella] hemipterigena TaxID=1531966 RepID=A0A0A1T725_9HYPO|nr:Putative Thiamin biosynthesis protein (Thi-4) [[Torrubiella] hemipterigena]
MPSIISPTTASQKTMTTMGKVLVVAGSDPSGGAGLEADQKVLAAHKCYAMTATTALTVQNTKGVTGVHIVPADFVASQIEAVAADIDIDVLKTGMLGSEETIIALAEKIVKLSMPIVVVDPVMVSTSGSQLLPQSAVQTLSTHLLPQTTLLTPNIPEAILILKQNGRPVPEIKSVADMEAIGRELQKLGPKWVLVKGGHVPLKSDLTAAETDADRVFVVDVLVGPEDLVVKIQASWQESTSTHGTGCSLASAISANLSNKMDVPSAVRSACRYVEAGIKTAPRIGQGNGPLNHFHSISSLPFSPGYFMEYLLSRADVCKVWDEFVYHPFVMGLGNGSLPLDSFKGYIIQDYLYLVHFSRANALAAYKSTNIKDIARSTEIVNHIAREMDLHIGYCKTFGISEAEIAATTELQACTAYTRYVLDIGMSQDWLALQMALAPCLLGYGAVAQMLLAHKDTVKDSKSNIYWAWIENYAAEDYTEAVRLGSELIETHIRTCSPARVEELIQIFIHATRMEIGFWEMFPAIQSQI